MTVYTIKEYDHKYGETITIGVADSIDNANRIIDEYYGNSKKLLYQEDIRNEYITYIKIFELLEIDEINTYNVTVTVEHFKLNRA